MSSLATDLQNQKKVLNIGILAHIDAGKTSLTERLLYNNGAISKLGSVDSGTTQTDANAIEKERGITIRSAVAAFIIDDLQVNIVDTPGHSDFIAEVERALSVLDGAIVVISVVEGIQAQTRILMRSLKKKSIPTILFINKIDRMGARTEDLLEDIRTKLNIPIVPMDRAINAGSSNATVVSSHNDFLAEKLSEYNDHLLKDLIEGVIPSKEVLEELFKKQIAQGSLCAVFFGSAIADIGISELTNAIKTFLRIKSDNAEHGEIKGTIFAIDRNTKGEKIAYMRVFSGNIRERQEITFSRLDETGTLIVYTGKISNLEIVGEHLEGQLTSEKVLTAGNIGKIKDISEIRVGDHVGISDIISSEPNFSPPSLTVVVKAVNPDQEIELHTALKNLTDEDPLIHSKVTDNGAISILLYGAVQKEVIAERLKCDFGIETIFDEIKPIYFERPKAKGEFVREFNPHDKNANCWATIGLRIEPAELGSGIRFIREAKWGIMPPAFYKAIEETVLQTLQKGLYGWAVTDCIVTLTRVSYNEPTSVAANFRNLTPIVLSNALRQAGTTVYEPCNDVEIEVPLNCVNTTISYINELGGDITRSLPQGAIWHIHADLPVRLVQIFTTALPGLSQGEGIVVLYPGVSKVVRGTIPLQNGL